MVSSSAKTASSANRSYSAALSRLVLIWIVARTARRPGQLVDLQRPAAAEPAEQILRGSGDVRL
jgi:hypothetical protein